MSLADFNVDDCLRKWRRKYGRETRAQSGVIYFSVPKEERRARLTVLLRLLKMKGMTREELDRATFIAKYLKIIFGGAPVADKARRQRGFEVVTDEFKDVLVVEVFEKKSRIKKKPVPILVPEKPEKSTAQPENQLPQTLKKGRFGKEADPSIFKDVPDVVNVVDEEFAKFLGVDPNE